MTGHQGIAFSILICPEQESDWATSVRFTSKIVTRHAEVSLLPQIFTLKSTTPIKSNLFSTIFQTHILFKSGY